MRKNANKQVFSQRPRQSWSICHSVRAKGLAWLKVEEDGLKGPIAKFMGEASEALIEATNAEVGDIFIIWCG